MKQNIVNEVNEILRLLKEGHRCYAEAAKRYYTLTNKRPDEDIDGFLIRNGVSNSTLQRLEQVGRGDLHPDLMLESCTIRNRLMDLPVTEQQKILTQPIPVVKEREGEPVTEYKRLAEMNDREKLQAVGVPAAEQIKAIAETNRFQKLKQQRAIANDQGVQILMPGFYPWEFFHAEEERVKKNAKPVTASELQDKLRANQVAA